MKGLTIHDMLWVAATVAVCMTGSATAGSLQAWGSDSDGQVTQVPTGSNFVGVAAGDAHGLGLRSNGTVVAWGQNDDGECRVPATTFRAIGAGADFSLAIRTDGSIAVWGKDAGGVVSKAPTGSNFAAVDGGLAFAVALTADGSIAAWGDNRSGQAAGAPKGTGFKAVVAGDEHGVALASNGALVTWGNPAAIQGTPTSGTYTAIAAGGTFCLAIKANGSLVWWGSDSNRYGLAQVPAGTDYIAIAAGFAHCLALKKDGSVVGWGAGVTNSGHPHLGQAKPPAGRDYTALACGLYYSLALMGDAGKTGISDNFDDDKQGTLWQFYGPDPSNCWLEEVHHRLELRATARTRMTPAYYLSNNWKLDPTKDFSFKVAFHCSLVSEQTGWVTAGLTPDVNDLNGKHVEFGPGCGQWYSHLWWEALGGAQPRVSFTDRYEDDGVLYISYNAKADELYLSTTGYGFQNSWGVVPGLLRGTWGGRPLTLYLGGGSDGQEIRSGEAYLDQFVIDTGAPAISPFSDVYRFSSPTLQAYFYTTRTAERDKVLQKYPKVWTYDGVAFKAATAQNSPGLVPVYRFWSLIGQGHLYTTDVTEKNKLISKSGKTWLYEGVAFYAYPQGAQPAASKPVYRFVRSKTGTHFYTINAAEKDELVRNSSKTWTLEGIAFYTYE